MDLKRYGRMYSPYLAVKTPIVDKSIPTAGDLERRFFLLFCALLIVVGPPIGNIRKSAEKHIYIDFFEF